MTRFAQRFVLERQIGAGGMARVYLANDEVLDRPVAVKILNPVHSGTDTGLRFRREGRTAARLAHPNVVQVYTAGEGEFEGHEVSYIVMEYVPGGDLKVLIDRKGILPSGQLAKIGSEVSSGLAHAHDNGVIHRDIKPHNILMDDHGRSRLSDFGVARALDATISTQTGSYLGTALYSSPEQLRGEKVTPRSDVYSLGITLYQAAVGEAPFTGTPIEVASQHINVAPPAPSTLGARLSSTVEALILDCVQKDPERRPTAEEVHERLRETAGAARPARAQASPLIAAESSTKTRTRTLPAEHPPAGPPPSEASTAIPSPGVQPEGGRRRRGPVILAVLTLLLVAALGIAAVALPESEEPADTAQAPREEPVEQAVLAGGSEEMAAEEEEQPAREESAADSSQEEGDAAEGPSQVVQDFYDLAAGEDYSAAYELMTEDYRARTFPSLEPFVGTFSTLESVTFVEGPTTGVTGGTATVAGTTIAEHTNRTERNGATWTLVDEGGQWKINEINVYQSERI